ncbi:MAG: hypothetical protein WB676_03010 [Bryobacteraceae bacterium]
MTLRVEALDAALSDLQPLGRLPNSSAARAALRPDQLNFTLGEDIAGAWRHIEIAFRDQLRELWRQLASCAYVESRSGEELLARSIVSYASNTQTLWNERLSLASMEQHQLKLGHSLSLRMRLLALIILALRLFAGFSAAVANPLLAPLAISNAAKLVARLRDLLIGGSSE